MAGSHAGGQLRLAPALTIGNLDSKTTMEVLQLMQRIVKEQDQTLVMVTHDNNLASYADRRIRIVDGKIVNIEVGQRRE